MLTNCSLTPGKSIQHLKDHKHYVQGVAWDPRGQFVATQSCDRCAVNIKKCLATQCPTFKCDFSGATVCTRCGPKRREAWNFEPMPQTQRPTFSQSSYRYALTRLCREHNV